MKRVIWDRQQEVGDWITARIQGKFHADSATTIGLERDGEIVGGCIFENHTGQSMLIHCAGISRYWMNRDFLMAVFGYAFRQMGIKKLIGPVDSSNSDSRHFIENLGFHPEATIADGARNGDLIMYTLTRQQCRFLGEQNG